MDDFQWDSPEHVGVARLDEQHRELHRLEHELLLDWFLDPMVQRAVPKARPLILLAKEVGEIIQRHHETVDRAYALWLKDR